MSNSGSKQAGNSRQKSREAAEPKLVVGIGASAGGLAAFRAFFSRMPADCGMAFVLVQHLAPDHNSVLAELLARETSMPVEEAQDGVLLEADRVYVIPPNATLTIEDGAIGITQPAPPRPERRPIDTFFSTLGAGHGDRAVGIVLSGVGSDGSRGLRSIKEHGGLTLAQAEFDATAMSGMPSSAVATGLVDFVLAVEDMPAKLKSHLDHLDATAVQRNAADGSDDVAVQLPAIFSLLQERTGHNFSGYKEKTLTRRIQRRMQVLQLSSAGEYTEHLRQRPSENDALFRELDIGVTQFFRDPAAFEALKAGVLSEIVAGGQSGESIRVWVPGCATGEEVYSIAILLREAMAHGRHGKSPIVFGTDIDERAIAAARTARYRGKPEGVSAERLDRWFRKNGEDHCPIASIREMCVFSTHSVVKDPPFSRLDLISCRNLMIYLDSDAQHRVMQSFHYALKPGGHLFLGPSESLTREGRLFKVTDKAHRILRRRDGVHVLPPALPGAVRRELGPTARRGPQPGDVIARAAERALAPHSPAALVVDRHYEILRFAGGEAGPYLDPSPGAASLNLFDILRKELRAPVRAALDKAMKSGAAVNHDLDYGVAGRPRPLSLAVEPVHDRETEEGLCVVIFREREDISTADAAGAAAQADESGSVTKQLRSTQAQLQAARDELESYLEEMKSATEEYQSVNEELQSTNEELETSKEEMQSVNEELQTINNELAAKNETTAELNSDLQNLLDSTQIATIFLNEDLIVRNFTPATTKLFPLRDSDRGRSLNDIVNLMSYDALSADVAKALRELTVIEREVSLKDGTATYMLRMRPYRTIKNVVNGVVLTFVDITERQRHDEQVHYIMGELSHRTNNLLTVILSMARQGIRRAGNPAEFFSGFESRILSLARSNELLVKQNWKGGNLGDLVQAQLAPFVDTQEGRLEVSGPPVVLTPAAVHSIGLALHELGTNASKHGALAARGGKVSVHAELHDMDGAGRRLRILWREIGGPAAEPPSHKGYGHVVLERVVPQQLDGLVAFEFTPEGVRWTLDAPAEKAVQDARKPIDSA